MEYKLLKLATADYHSFEKLVNDELKKGWIPTGGVYIHWQQDAHVYVQALVRPAQ